MENRITSYGYGVKNSQENFKPLQFSRRDIKTDDVLIDILYCGVCHTDIHFANNDFGGTNYPLIPGHEIVGRVLEVGDEVSNFKKGDLVGVGCFVDSCRECSACKNNQEQYCSFVTATYNSKDKSGEITKGGYSNNIVVREEFVLSIPDSLNLSTSAPLLCAGITTYSPLRHWNVGEGQKVGVVGLGGLGHMALKFAHAMGAYVVQFTRSQHKVEDAKQLGADEVILSTDEKQMDEHRESFDFILDTVSAEHDINPLLTMLKQDGNLVSVGVPPSIPSIIPFHLISKRRSLSGSLVGGIKETQEMLNYCGEKGIECETELISIQDIDKAYERTLNADVKYRFVIDMNSLKEDKNTPENIEE